MSTRGGQRAVHDRSHPPRSELPSSDKDDDSAVESVPEDPDHHAWCGQILEERRADLKLSLRKAAAKGPMAHSTLGHFESGERAPVYPKTYRMLDDIYDYLPGSTKKLYERGLRPIKKEAQPPAGLPPLPTDEWPVELSPGLLEDLLDASQQLQDAVETIGDPELTARQQSMQHTVERVFRAWQIAQIEGNRVAGNDNRFMTTVLSQQVRGMIRKDDPDHDEIAYMRWLLGRTDGVPPEDITRFEQRLARRTRRRSTDADADA